jgi:hypothetical protein
VLGHSQGLNFANFCIKKIPVEGYARGDLITSSEFIYFFKAVQQ